MQCSPDVASVGGIRGTLLPMDHALLWLWGPSGWWDVRVSNAGDESEGIMAKCRRISAKSVGGSTDSRRSLECPWRIHC